MKNKVALITGITGQDGSIMAKFLLKKGYIVHGIKRRISLFNTERVEDIYQDRHDKRVNFFLHYGDITDALNCLDIIKKTKPDEIYHFAAQSHVAISFQMPIYTSTVGTIGTLNILESIRLLKLKKIRFYNAASSEMYGNSKQKIQNEKTIFEPNSPYATSKLYSYWITKNYRESYKIFASNGMGYDVMPSGPSLVAAESHLRNGGDQERALMNFLSENGRRYDYILIDCPPSLNLLTLNGLRAAKNLTPDEWNQMQSYLDQMKKKPKAKKRGK